MTNHRAPHTIDVGTILAGKYRVDRLLGKGGMGIVFGVRHLELQEDFAIKLMQGREFDNPRAVERFLREARAAVRLRSKTEHIVQVHDVGRIESGEPYIVMELLAGQDLNDLLAARGVLPIAEACTYVIQAGHALHAAHQLGIIHRDLKPANLFLAHRPDGSPCIKVLDFGISKHVVSGDDSTDVEITGTQDVMGSPLYMSPELAKAARNASPGSDIWALGAILYKLLTGRAPFQSASPAELFASLLAPTPPPRPTEFRPNVPKSLESVIMRCLEKNLALRYDNVAELSRDLAPFTAIDESEHDDTSGSTVLLQLARAIGPTPAAPLFVDNRHPQGSEKPAAPPERSDAAFPAPSRHVRRPSFVEGLPVGFELQPPPAPPQTPPPADALATPQSLQVAAREPMPSVGSGQTSPTATPLPIPMQSSRLGISLSNDVGVSRPTYPLTEATGSTWGGTNSRLSAPAKRGRRVLVALAGISILVLMMALVGIAIIPQTENAASSSESVEPTRSAAAMDIGSPRPPKDQVPDVLPTSSIAPKEVASSMTSTTSTTSKDKPMAASKPIPIVKPTPAPHAAAATATNTNRPDTTKTTPKKKSNFETW